MMPGVSNHWDVVIDMSLVTVCPSLSSSCRDIDNNHDGLIELIQAVIIVSNHVLDSGSVRSMEEFSVMGFPR